MGDYSEIRAQLEEKLNQLVTRAQRIDDDLSETPDEDWEDRASETEGDEVLASVGHATLEEIEQIKRAIHQIDTGTYGRCARCGREIPRQRLKALPQASTCMHCS
jgi:RNA polymerase-binding protein DksA